MPPDHGAAAVHIILEDARASRALAGRARRDARPDQFGARSGSPRPTRGSPIIGRQFGMFSMLPLSKEQVLKLRDDHAIYMADSGRFNVVGMGDDQIDRFIAAVVEALDA